MQGQAKFEDSELCPSFSCYSSDSPTSIAVAKVIREEHDTEEAAAAPFHEFGDINEEEFEFSLTLSDNEEIDSEGGWTVFPVFNRDLLVNDEFKANFDDDEINVSSSSITSPLRKLLIDEERVECSSNSSYSSSSETEELEHQPSGTFCIWIPKAEGSFSPKCKKSSSTGGSGSKKWIEIRYLLRRSNSEGKDPIMLLTSKHKQNSDKVSKVVGMLKGKPSSVHEQFYVQRRAENEAGKRKTYLPYRRDLVGLFSNINGIGKMLPF